MPHFTVRLGDKEIDLPEADTRDQALLKAGLTPAHWPALHVGTEVQTDTSIHSQTKEKERNIAKKATQGNSTTPAPSAQLVFETVTKVDFALIVGNPYQPESRKKPPADVLERMAASIQEHGLLQTPVVRSTRQGYEMGDGWIRACAYRKLWDDTKDKKWRDLPVVIREMTDKQMADLVMEANTVRNDLSAIDLAKFYKRYMADFKVTQTELARIHHITQGEVANTIRLLELPENIQAKVISHEISETHARTLLQVSDPKEITRMADKVSKDGLSVVELDRQVKADLWNKTLSLDEKDNFGGGPRFDISACEKCDHRVMVKDPWQSKKEAVPRCNDRDCWSKKQGEANIAANQKQVDAIKAQGVTNFPDKAPEFCKGLYDYTLSRLDKPEDCRSCEKRVAMPRYGGQYEISCTDKACYTAKEKTKRQAEEHAKEAAEEKTAKAIADIFNQLPVNVHSARAALECFLNACEDSETFEAFVKAYDLPNTEDMELDDDEQAVDVVLEAIDARMDKAGTEAPTLLIQMIFRLAFENARADFYGRRRQQEYLNAFKAAKLNMPYKKREKKAGKDGGAGEEDADE